MHVLLKGIARPGQTVFETVASVPLAPTRADLVASSAHQIDILSLTFDVVEQIAEPESLSVFVLSDLSLDLIKKGSRIRLVLDNRGKLSQSFQLSLSDAPPRYEHERISRSIPVEYR